MEDLERGFIDNSNKLSTQQNHLSRKKRYKEFCEFSRIKPYPVTEFKISKFAVFLSDIMKTVESIKMYCGTICEENELLGYKPVRRGLKYHKTLAGIKRKLRHRVKQAAPMTPELLCEILTVVNLHDDKEFVTWVATITCYSLVLRKSNIVPLKRIHDKVQNISRKDVRYSNGVMVFSIEWSKTNQFQEEREVSPLVANKLNLACPVRWLLYMMKRVPAGQNHNLFSFHGKNGVTPITYRDLMVHLRKWLKKLGKDPKSFSSHSLRRGASTAAHKRKISALTLKKMGSWKSDCYQKYVDIDLDTRVRAWFQFSNM